MRRRARIALCCAALALLGGTVANLPAVAQVADNTETQPPNGVLPVRLSEADRLFRQGQSLYRQGEIDKALDAWRQALTVYQDTTIQAAFPERAAQNARATLSNIGMAYQLLGQPDAATVAYEQVLTLIESIADRFGATETLRLNQVSVLESLGNAHRERRAYGTALEIYTRQLSIIATIAEVYGESEVLLLQQASALGRLGVTHRNLSQYRSALERYEQQLTLLNAIDAAYGRSHKRQLMTATVVGNLGIVYRNLGQYDTAVEYFERQLQQLQTITADDGLDYERQRIEARARGNLGNAYSNLGRYSDAIDQYEQQLAIAQQLEPLEASQAQLIRARALGGLGIVYRSLGQYDLSIKHYEQQLQISLALSDSASEAAALGNIGIAYRERGEYAKAIEQYEQQLQIARTLGDRALEATALGNLGIAYRELGEYTMALTAYEQGLAVMRQIGDRRGEALILGNLGITYSRLQQYLEAFESLQQALISFESIDAPAEAAKTLSELGQLFVRQNRPQLAIVFYKASVNRHEAIRRNIDALPQTQQQTFVESVAEDYRALAELLLQENRLLEAQAVLDLLKLQELDEYLHDTRSDGPTEDGVDYWEPEQRILELYRTTLLAEEELRYLQSKPYSSLTDSERDRLGELTTDQTALFNSFDQFLALPEVEAALVQLRQSSELIDLENLAQLQDNLANLDNAVLLYPLILDDRLELLLVTPYSPPLRYSVLVSAAELNRTILEFRESLTSPWRDAFVPAQQLYDWLLRPLEHALETVQAETIVYAPDGPLRYIPMAALHNGDRWVVEQFKITHITAASLTDFDTPIQSNLRVLAAACAACSFSFEIGDRQFQFQDLPFTAAEVETLAAQIPETDTLIDQAFNPNEVLLRLGSYTVLHLATHAAFVSGQPDESFIVFGNGERATLQDIRGWNLRNIDLVVLSACETAVGETDLGNGTEILGFGYQMQRTGADAAIASLWQVNDWGTQVLMNAFYTALKDVSKAEALRQAQLTLIQSSAANGISLGELEERQSRAAEISVVGLTTSERSLSHPYYWAPFILIGNGL